MITGDEVQKGVVAPNTEWAQVLDHSFVEKVHLATVAMSPPQPNGQVFWHRGAMHFRNSEGHVFKLVNEVEVTE